jgi:hypothetical protein
VSKFEGKLQTQVVEISFLDLGGDTKVLSVTETMLRISIYIYMCVCVVNDTFFEGLPGQATCYIVCFSVLKEISCIVNSKFVKYVFTVT